MGVSGVSDADGGFSDPGRIEALSRKVDTMREELWDLQEKVEGLEDRIADLESLKNPNPEATDYDSMDRDTKVQKVRLALIDRAATRPTGKARMEYNEVLALFDHHPSSGHVYDLMRLAANLDGFRYKTPMGDNNAVLVDLEAVKNETMLSYANKRQRSGGA